MNLSLLIYLLSVVDGISSVIVAGMVIMFIFSLGCIIIKFMWNVDEIDKTFPEWFKKKYKVIRKYCIIACILMIVNILMPNSKVIATMYLLPKIVKNEDVKNIPQKALKLLNLKLDGWLKDNELIEKSK